VSATLSFALQTFEQINNVNMNVISYLRIWLADLHETLLDFGYHPTISESHDKIGDEINKWW
jgi:hypothetical protein